MLPVNLQDRMGILGFSECRRTVFQGVAIELAFGDTV